MMIMNCKKMLIHTGLHCSFEDVKHVGTEETKSTHFTTTKIYYAFCYKFN